MIRLLIALLVLTGGVTYALPAGCTYCVSYSCFDSDICGEGCFCAKRNNEVQGVCMGG